MVDKINHPDHYTAGGVETIDLIEAKELNFNLGNVIKYVSRCGRKDNALEDLHKAKWYLLREIARREKCNEDDRYRTYEESVPCGQSGDVHVPNTLGVKGAKVPCSRK